MASASDFGNIPGMTREVRDGVASAFDTLSRWRDEVETVNERYVSKVLDQTSAVARSMGWPEQAVRATREYLEKISKTQTDMIDQIMETWKHQLTATTAPMAMPHGFTRQMTGATSAFSGAMPQFNPLEPWTFWFQAAEMWQRTWMPELSQRDWRRH